MQKYKKLILNIFIFGIGGFGQKILTFFLVPLYTVYLSTHEYGMVDLLINLVQLIFPIFNLGIHYAILSFALDKQNNPNIVCKIGKRYNIISTIIFLIGTIFLRYIGMLQMSNSYLAFLAILYVVSVWRDYFIIAAKIYNKIVLVAVSGFVNTLIYFGLNIIFLKYWSLGIKGYMLAYIIGLLISMIMLIIGLGERNYLENKYDRELSKRMRKFSSSMIFNHAAWWINNVSDRYMLIWMSGAQLSGIYSIAYKVPNILSVCQTIVTQAWSISAIEEHDNTEVTDYYSKVFSIYYSLLCIVISVLLLFNSAISKILFHNDFYEAKKYVPILLLAVAYSGCSEFFNSIFVAEKDSFRIMKSTIIGAIVNILLNILLIPFFLIYGAAIATMISNLLIMIYRFIILYREKKIDILIFRPIVLNVLLIAQAILCNQERYTEQGFILACILLLVYKVLLELYLKLRDDIWKIKVEK